MQPLDSGLQGVAPNGAPTRPETELEAACAHFHRLVLVRPRQGVVEQVRGVARPVWIEDLRARDKAEVGPHRGP